VGGRKHDDELLVKTLFLLLLFFFFFSQKTWLWHFVIADWSTRKCLILWWCMHACNPWHGCWILLGFGILQPANLALAFCLCRLIHRLVFDPLMMHACIQPLALLWNIVGFWHSSASKLSPGILSLQTDPKASVWSSNDACMHSTLGIAVESCWVFAFSFSYFFGGEGFTGQSSWLMLDVRMTKKLRVWVWSLRMNPLNQWWHTCKENCASSLLSHCSMSLTMKAFRTLTPPSTGSSMTFVLTKLVASTCQTLDGLQ